MNFRQRSTEDELMDDLSRPDHEFAQAYRELEIVNRWLGGMRAIERFLPRMSNPLILDVAAGACDISEKLITRLQCRIVVLDRNAKGLKLAKRSLPVVGDAFAPPFPDDTFDVVMASLFFHHLSDDDCVRVLTNMWRLARRCLFINDLHRHPLAYFSIRALSAVFSKSPMFRHDAPVSVMRAFRPRELAGIANKAGVPAKLFRSFPYRLVLVAHK